MLNQLGINTILDEFKTCSQIRFDGKLEWQSTNNQTWSFYYRLGRIVWATGGVHPIRRWRRQISKHCPELDPSKLQFPTVDFNTDLWEYNLLTMLHKLKKLSLQEFAAVVYSTIKELLFELLLNSEQLTSDRNQEELLDVPIILSSIDLFFKQIQETSQAWQGWQDAGLDNLSPNLAPIVRKPQQLKQEVGVNKPVYQNIIKLMNGKYTLSDLSVRMNQDILPLTVLLLPYIKRGIIELIELSALPLPVSERQKVSATVKPTPNYIPLIACVDDSLHICGMLEQIINSIELKLIGSQNLLKALPILINKKPNLIFLDLVMPVANGYEVCDRLRRVSIFAKAPIVILTGNDGLVDRVRTKMVGATDSIAKAVEREKVVAVIQKYLPDSVPSRTSP